MKMKFIAVALVLVVFGAAGALWSSWLRSEPDTTIRLSGNIELTEINVAFKTAGKLVELGADEGTAVHRGMLLAGIDQDQIQRQLKKAQTVVAPAKSEYRTPSNAVQ